MSTEDQAPTSTAVWDRKLQVAFYAGVLIVALSLFTRGWRDGRPQFERAEVAETGELVVRLDRDAHLTLVAVLEDGGLLHQPEAGPGAVAGGVDRPLEGLPGDLVSPITGEPRSVRWWLVLAGRSPLSPELLEPFLQLRAGFPAELDHLGLRLQDDLGVRVRRLRAGS